MSTGPDISAVITAHTEGPMAGLSFRSLLDAVGVARADGVTVEVLVVLDAPDPATREAFSEAEQLGCRVIEVSYGDQGPVRNEAASRASGRYVAFLDADDLWSENWLAEAYRMCESDPGRVIAHPAVNWFFGGTNYVYFLTDQTDPGFDPAYLRVANYWDTLCLAPVAAYRDIPFLTRDLAEGFAYEDWHWNMETVAAGFVHRVAPDTLHFKRRRVRSQTVEATANKSLTRPSRFLDYAWIADQERGRDRGSPLRRTPATPTLT